VRENPTMYSVPVWNTSQEEKGIVWEVGCHPAYLQLHFLENISEVYAVGKKSKYPVFDEFTVLLRASNQSCGIIEVSWLSRETEKIYEINSSNGKRAFMISSPPWASEGYDVLYEKTGLTQSDFFSDVKKVLKRLHRKPTPFGYHIGHYYLIRDFVKSLEDDAPPPVTPQDGKRVIGLLECIDKSLNTGEAVSMRVSD
jgi:predicted dehydrogenase